MTRGVRWTKKQEQALLQGVGVYGLAWFRKHGGNSFEWPNGPRGRTLYAVYSKARRMYGTGGLTRGAYSIRRIMNTSGYSLTQIRRAMRALAQKWKRLTPRGAYLIYEEQYEDLVQWLGTDYWAKHHRLYNCLWCHETRFVHKGKGLCMRCYRRYVKSLERADLPRENKELLALVRKWIDSEDKQKIEKQLLRGRALPELVVGELRAVLCLSG